MIRITNEIQNLIDQGAVFYCSHSGGKDSQVMYANLSQAIPADQLVVVHAHLGEMEWDGVLEHIESNINSDLNVVEASKTFFDMVERRHESRPDVPPFPSSATRQCTSDLKRDPIHKFIRNDLKARGTFLGVNCTGIRKEESPARSKKNPFQLNKRLSKAGREVYEWMPIFDMTEQEVYDGIYNAGQKPFWAYKNNRRLSCVFCIMGHPDDLAHGAKHRNELVVKLTNLENASGYTMFNGKSLQDRIEEGTVRNNEYYRLQSHTS